MIPNGQEIPNRIVFHQPVPLRIIVILLLTPSLRMLFVVSSSSSSLPLLLTTMCRVYIFIWDVRYLVNGFHLLYLAAVVRLDGKGKEVLIVRIQIQSLTTWLIDHISPNSQLVKDHGSISNHNGYLIVSIQVKRCFYPLKRSHAF